MPSNIPYCSFSACITIYGAFFKACRSFSFVLFCFVSFGDPCLAISNGAEGRIKNNFARFHRGSHTLFFKNKRAHWFIFYFYFLNKRLTFLHQLCQKNQHTGLYVNSWPSNNKNLEKAICVFLKNTLQQLVSAFLCPLICVRKYSLGPFDLKITMSSTTPPPWRPSEQIVVIKLASCL